MGDVRAVSIGKRLRPRRVMVRLGREGGRITWLHDELEGLLSVEETRFLFTRPREVCGGCEGRGGGGRIVEIGSFRGKSCVLMALGAPGARVTCIDPHEPTHFGGFSSADHEAFESTIRRHGVADRVTHLRMRSHEARGSWEEGEASALLWVDGDHSHEGARTDFEDWAGLVRVGGIVAAHDAFRARFPGVMRAWREVIEAGGGAGPGGARFGRTRRVRSIAWAFREG